MHKDWAHFYVQLSDWNLEEIFKDANAPLLTIYQETYLLHAGSDYSHAAPFKMYSRNRI